MTRTNAPRLNLLGVVSILIGMAAFVATKVALAGYGPVPIALLGIGVGLLAFLLSLMTGRWSSGVAVLGILVSAGALALVGYNNGTLPGWWAKFHPKAEKPVPAVVAPAPPAPVDAPSGPHVHSIFDNDNSSSGSPGVLRSAAPAPGITPAPSPTISTPAPLPAPTPAIALPPAPTLGGARAKLDAATMAVEHSLANDPAYLAASAVVTAADAKRKAALADGGPGSPQVLEASTQWLDAKSNLKKLVEAAAAKDPAVQAAQREMSEAEASIRAGKSGNGK